MTVFKAFWKVVGKYKFILILYTVLLVGFTGFNMTTNDNSANFVADKPDVLIVNHDDNIGITNALIEYIKENCNIKDIKNDSDSIKDALFYRDVNLIIYIPENFRNDFLNGLNPEIDIESTGDYEASLAELLLSRFVKNANIYIKENQNEDEIIEKIKNTLKKESEIKMTSKLDSNNLDRAVFYFNFLNYSLLAGCVYIICVALSSFREEKIQKRTIISSIDFKKHNKLLLLSNGVLTVMLWLIYIILSFVLLGKTMFSMHGVVLIINSFIFALCSLSIAFLIANIVKNKQALSGIVNVVALGSSFLSGAFIPVKWLPKYILKIAHILPSYWFVQNNELVRTLEELNSKTVNSLITNTCMLFLFIIFFIILTNVISKKKRKIA